MNIHPTILTVNITKAQFSHQILFTGWCWYWFGLADAGFFEKKILLTG